MIKILRLRRSNWIDRWWVFEPCSKGLIKSLGIQGKEMKVQTIIGTNIGIRVERERL